MSAKVNIRPLGDRVLIKRVDPELKTAGGIVIPDTASKDKPVEGVILAVGPGKPDDTGRFRELSVKSGDKVLFGKYAGTEVKFQDQDLVIMRGDDLLGVIEG